MASHVFYDDFYCNQNLNYEGDYTRIEHKNKKYVIEANQNDSLLHF